MNRYKKKSSKLLFTLLLFTLFFIIALVVYYLFMYAEEQSAYSSGSSNVVAVPALISTNSDGAVYQLSWSGDSISSGCDAKLYHNINFDVMWYTDGGEKDLPELVYELDIISWFNTTNVYLNGYTVTVDACSGSPKNGELVFDSLSAVCKIIDMGVYNPTVTPYHRAGMTCKVSALAHAELNSQIVSSDIAGFSSGAIQAMIYNEGYVPPINENNTILTPYYLFSNNACELVQIEESQKTSNHYETLEECQSKIISPGILHSIGSFISNVFNSIINFFKKIFSDLKFI